MKYLFCICMFATTAFAEIVETALSTSLKQGGKTIWTYNHDPAKGKPYFHPLASTDGTMFTDVPTSDHPWHRGLWFSWKFINGVNYWEEIGYTGVPREGYTRLLSTENEISDSNALRIEQRLEYAPSKDAASIMTEARTIQVSAPDNDGVYMIDWFCSFTAEDEDLLLDRTPLPDEPRGKAHGGYAGLSVRMNKEVGAVGKFVNSSGLEGMDTRRKASPWQYFTVENGGSLLFMEHPETLNHPGKWYVSTKMPYFSPAVIHDGAYTIKAGETLTLKYRIVLSPSELTQEAAEQFWSEWKSTTVEKERQPNVLLLCVDDLRQEGDSPGMRFAVTPNMDRLAASGRLFTRHFSNAPTCGASRYTLLTGRYGPTGNHALWARSKKIAQGNVPVPQSMPEWFRSNGYTTVSVGKVSHTPGGLGGKDFNDSTTQEMPRAWNSCIMPVGPWLTPKGAMHGLAHGATHASVKGSLHVFEAEEGADDIYNDGLITNEALEQLDALTADDSKPFFLAVGFIKPHLPFGAPKKYLDLYKGVEIPPAPHSVKPKGLSTWYPSDEFMRYNRWEKDPRTDVEFAKEVRRHYAACVSYADAQIGRLLHKLKETGADQNTVIVVWGDHGWNLGEHGIWGKHNLFDEGLHAPLIIVSPKIKEAGQASSAMVEALDVFPTLCELTGLEVPDFVEGKSLLPQLENPDAKGRAAICYWREVQGIRTERYRMVLHPDGQKELYDHQSPEKETKNIAAEHSELSIELQRQINERIQQRRWW